MWEKARMEFITSNSQKISGQTIPNVILVIDGVGDGYLGMVTTFCCHNQAKIEASDALSALYQCDPPDPSVVVVRRYTNTPYILWGSSCLPYLEVSTLSEGTSSTQLPLYWLHLHRLLPFSDTEVVLHWEEGEMGLKVFLHFWEALWQSSGEEHNLSDLISLLVPSLASNPHQEEGIQMEEGLSFHPALKLLQDVNQARAQLECELAQEIQ